MRRFLLLGMVLVLLTSCKSKQLTANSPEKYDLEILADVIKKQILNDIYPEAQIAEGTELFEEGTRECPYSILYPHTRDKVLVIWRDQERTKLYQIYLDAENRWRSNKGIRVGTTYEELVELNGGPLKIYGFGWDYSGAVDWNGGGLTNSNIRVFLEPQVAPPMDFYTDQIIEITDDEIEALKLKVRAIIFQEPEAKELAQVESKVKKS